LGSGASSARAARGNRQAAKITGVIRDRRDNIETSVFGDERPRLSARNGAARCNLGA